MSFKSYLLQEVGEESNVPTQDVEQILVDFFTNTKSPTNENVQELAKTLGLELAEVQTKIYQTLSNFFAFGAFAENKVSDIDQEQLNRGIKEEMEHTNDSYIATKIAKDHLAKSPHYYEYLESMESQMNSDLGPFAKAKEA